MDTKELQEIVNPIYSTAKGTILTLAAGSVNVPLWCAISM